MFVTNVFFQLNLFEQVSNCIFQFEPVLAGVGLQCIGFHIEYCQEIEMTPCCFGVDGAIVFCKEHLTSFFGEAEPPPSDEVHR